MADSNDGHGPGVAPAPVSPSADARTATTARRRRSGAAVLAFGALGLLALLLLVVGGSVAALWWAAGSASGTAWVLSKIDGLTVTAPRGALLGDFEADRIELVLPASAAAKRAGGADGRVVLAQAGWRGLQLRIRPNDPTRTWLHVALADLHAQRIDLAPPADDPAQPKKPLRPPRSLRLPVEVDLAKLRVGELHAAALGEQPLRDLSARLHVGADGGSRHRVEQLSVAWDRLRVGAADASIGADAPFTLDVQVAVAQAAPSPVLAAASAATAGAAGSVTSAATPTPASASASAAAAPPPPAAPAWRATVAATGPLAQPTVTATLRALAVPAGSASASAAGGSGTEQSLDARAVLRPFEGWPLAELSAGTRDFDLSALLPGAPATALSGRADVRTLGLDQPATLALQIDNARAGRWNDGLLPLRRLNVELLGRPDDRRVLDLRTFDAELGSAAQPAGQLRGSGRWTPDRSTLDVRLTAVQPALLDARAAPMRLDGTLSLAAHGVDPAAPERAVLDVRADLSGPLNGVLDAIGRPPAASSAARTLPSRSAAASATARAASPSRAVPDAHPPRVATAAHGAAPPTARLRLDATASRLKVDLREAVASVGGARASLSGSAEREAADAPWHAKAQASLVDFDPLPWWPGAGDSPWRRGPHRVNASAGLDLTLPPPAGSAGTAVGDTAPRRAPVPARSAGPAVPAASPIDPWLAALAGSATLNVERGSVLAGVPVAAQAAVKQAAGGIAQATLSADLAGNRIDASAQLSTSTAPNAGAADQLALTLAAPDLSRLAPLWRLALPAAGDGALAGALNGSASVRGRWPDISSSGQLDGSRLLVALPGGAAAAAAAVVDASGTAPTTARSVAGRSPAAAASPAASAMATSPVASAADASPVAPAATPAAAREPVDRRSAAAARPVRSARQTTAAARTSTTAATARRVASPAAVATTAPVPAGRDVPVTGSTADRRLRIQSVQARWQLGTAANAKVDVQATLNGASLAGAGGTDGPSVDSAQLRLQGTAASHTLSLIAESKALPPAWTDALQANLPTPVLAAAAAAVPAGSAPGSGLPAGADRAAATPPPPRTVAVLQLQGGLTEGSGGAVNGSATADAGRPLGSLSASASGWRGTLQRIELRSSRAGAAPLLLARDVAVSTQWSGSPARLVVQPGRLDVLGAALRFGRIDWQAGTPGGGPARLNAQADLDPLPVAPLLARLQPDFGWGGDLRVGGRLLVRTLATPAGASAFSADVVVERAGGDLTVTDEFGTQSLGLSDLRLGLNAQNGVWSFTQALAGQALGVAAGAVVARTSPAATWPAADTPIQGVLELRVANLATWGTWVPTGWRLGGELRTSASIGGRFGAPEYTGQVRGSGLWVRNFLQGVNVNDGELAVTLAGSTARIERFTAKGGSGSVTLDGDASLGAAPRAALRLHAERFQLLGRVDRRIVASGDARLTLNRDAIALDGQLTVDEGLIDFSRGDAPSLSDDVVVLRRPAAASAAQAMAVVAGAPTLPVAGAPGGAAVRAAGAGSLAAASSGTPAGPPTSSVARANGTAARGPAAPNGAGAGGAANGSPATATAAAATATAAATSVSPTPTGANRAPSSAPTTAAAPATGSPAGSGRALALNLQVDLGTQLRLRGRGLDSGLRGQLRISSPNNRLAVNGTVSTSGGTYAAYGQKLAIDRGAITFAGSVDNPRLDIEATRPDIDTRVGVRVSGTALNPRVRLFSEPELADIDKLSWLVLGRASDGTGGADAALLQRAAMALFAGESEGTASQWTKAIGLDDISLRQTDGEVRSTVISLGKQISQRWYVGYERGLNATAGSWQLIYRVARRFTLRAQTGDDNSLDMIWSWRWQ